MLQSWTKSWPLLALCSAFFAAMVFIYLGMMHYLIYVRTLVLGEFTVAAGACVLAAGLRWQKDAWERRPLMLLGIALAALGLYFCFFFYNWYFIPRPAGIGLAIGGLAMGAVAALELPTAVALRRRRRVVDGVLLGMAGAISAGVTLRLFVGVFALIFHWQDLAGPGFGFFLLICNLGVTAICILVLLLRQRDRIPFAQILKPEEGNRHRLLRRKTAMAMAAAGALIFLLSPAANYLAARAKAHAFLSAHPEIQNVHFRLLDPGRYNNPNPRSHYLLLDPRTDALAREHFVLEFEPLGVIETSRGDAVAKVLSSGYLDFGGVPGWTVASLGLLCAGLVLGGLVLTSRTNGGAVV